MAAVEVKVPDIGDFKDVEIIEVLVKPGDTHPAEQSLVTVESDKASMEIPSSAAGVVKEMSVKVGDKVNEGIGAAAARRRAAAAGARVRGRCRAAAPSRAAAPAAVGRRRRGRSACAVRGGAAATSRSSCPTSATSSEVAVIEVLVKPGDTVAIEQSLITVESDKASMEIPSSAAGVVKELKVQGRRQGLARQPARDCRSRAGSVRRRARR